MICSQDVLFYYRELKRVPHKDITTFTSRVTNQLKVFGFVFFVTRSIFFKHISHFGP